ncbi:DUF6300 family protein [Kitasatospora sp. NPDC001683]
MNHVQVIRTGDLPPCPRCDRPVLLVARIPLGGDVDLHLCRHCDTGPTAGGRLVAILGLPDGERPLDLFREFTAAWMYEGLAAQGWHQVPPAEGQGPDVDSPRQP